MKTKNKALLSGPFLVWTAAFIVIPLFMVIYYGFTGEDGSFTLENVKRILAPHYLKSLWLALLLSLVSTVACLIMSYPLAMILSKLKGNQSQLIVLADVTGEKRCHQHRPACSPFAFPEDHQYTLRHCPGYDL